MKVKFSKTVEYIPTWRGNAGLAPAEQIKVQLNVLQFNDLLQIMEEFQKKGADGKPDARAVSSLAMNLLPRYATIQNLEDDSGPMTMEQIVQYPSFMDLSTELLGKLSEISMPGDRDEKNLVTQPG